MYDCDLLYLIKNFNKEVPIQTYHLSVTIGSGFYMFISYKHIETKIITM